MYQFRITEEEKGGYRFELEGIKILVDDYKIENDKHVLTNPNKAIAFFDIEHNLYGISNQSTVYYSVEDFYEEMLKQFDVFTHA